MAPRELQTIEGAYATDLVLLLEELLMRGLQPFIPLFFSRNYAPFFCKIARTKPFLLLSN